MRVIKWRTAVEDVPVEELQVEVHDGAYRVRMRCLCFDQDYVISDLEEEAGVLHFHGLLKANGYEASYEFTLSDADETSCVIHEQGLERWVRVERNGLMKWRSADPHAVLEYDLSETDGEYTIGAVDIEDGEVMEISNVEKIGERLRFKMRCRSTGYETRFEFNLTDGEETECYYWTKGVEKWDRVRD